MAEKKVHLALNNNHSLILDQGDFVCNVNKGISQSFYCKEKFLG
jgi:hypothetical protein